MIGNINLIFFETTLISFSSDELNQFFEGGDLTHTETFLVAAKNFDVVALEELNNYMQGVLVFAKAKASLKKHEIALVAKEAALNYAQLKKHESKAKFKVAKFHVVHHDSDSEEDADDL